MDLGTLQACRAKAHYQPSCAEIPALQMALSSAIGTHLVKRESDAQRAVIECCHQSNGAFDLYMGQLMAGTDNLSPQNNSALLCGQVPADPAIHHIAVPG